MYIDEIGRKLEGDKEDLHRVTPRQRTRESSRVAWDGVVEDAKVGGEVKPISLDILLVRVASA